MAGLDMTMKVKSAEYRPCVVGGRKALFHRWVESDKVIFENVALMSHEMKAEQINQFKNFGMVDNMCTKLRIIKSFYGLVEYGDGTVEKVDPEKIVFKDSDHMFESVGAAWND